ncbi:MAG TPA: hypothetical protein VEJ84_18900, partial [Acidimicrobiales bacterium]|nr:hypothetical protein [Acidimicrobiales bacterium]
MTAGLVGTAQVESSGDFAEAEALGRKPWSAVAKHTVARLGLLSEQARAVLRTAAALGDRFCLTELASVYGQPLPHLVEAITEALDTGVLASSGSELIFVDPITRDVLYEEVPEEDRTAVHANAAKVLAYAGAPWDRVARQLLAARQDIDGWALQWLADLRPVELHASPGLAAELLERARHVVAYSDRSRDALVARETAVLRLLHRQDDLVRLGTAALRELADPALVGEVTWNLARGYSASGQIDQELSVISQALARPDLGVPWRSRLRALRARDLVFGDRPEQGRPEARLAISEGERDGDGVSIAWGLVALAADEPDPGEVRALTARALEALIGDDPESLDLRATLLVEQLTPEFSSFDDFEAAWPGAEALARCAGTMARLSQVQLVAAERFFEAGEWDRALLYLDHLGPLTAPPHLLRWH